MKRDKTYQKLLERKEKSYIRLQKHILESKNLEKTLNDTELLERTAKVRTIRRTSKNRLTLTRIRIVREKENYNKILDKLKGYL